MKILGIVPQIKNRLRVVTGSFIFPYTVVIFFAELVQFFLNPRGAFQGDSKAYGFGADRDWSLLSFTGNSLRNWPLVSINLSLGNQMLQVFFLFAISIGSWVCLLFQTKNYFRSINRHIVSIAIVLLAVSPQVLSWNSTLLSESLCISILVFICSLILGSNSIKSRSNHYFIVTLIFFWVCIKPSNFLAFLVTSIFVGFVYVNEGKGRNKIQINIVQNRILVLIISIGLLWAAMLNLNQSAQAFDSGVNYKTAQALTVLSNQNPRIKEVARALDQDKNLYCFNLASPKTLPDNLVEIQTVCSIDQKWLSESFITWYIKYLASNPIEVIYLSIFGLLAGNSPFGYYAGSISILDKPIFGIFFGERNFALRLSDSSIVDFNSEKLIAFAPIIFWIIIYFLLRLPLFNGKQKNKDNSNIDFFEHRIDTLSKHLIALAFFGIICISVLTPTEWFRQTIQFQVVFYLGVIFYLGNFIQRKWSSKL